MKNETYETITTEPGTILIETDVPAEPEPENDASFNLSDFKLLPETEDIAHDAFQSGHSSGSIVNHLIANANAFPEIAVLLQHVNTPAAKKTLHARLRRCNPKDEKYTYYSAPSQPGNALAPIATPQRDNAHLSPETKLHCVALFARGYSPTGVLETLLQQPPKELHLAMDIQPTEVLREKLLSQLRTCNPADSKFATSKYANYYNEQRQALQAALLAKAHQHLDTQLQCYEDIRSDANDLAQSLKLMLQDASESTITGNAEFTKTATLLLNAQKMMMQAGERQLQILTQLCTGDINPVSLEMPLPTEK